MVGKHPLECDFERTVWDQQEGLPFSVKRPLLLRLWEGQGSVVPSAHSVHHTQPIAWCCNSLQEPLGQQWKQLSTQRAAQFFQPRLPKRCYFETVTGRVMCEFHISTLTTSVIPQPMSDVLSAMRNQVFKPAKMCSFSTWT